MRIMITGDSNGVDSKKLCRGQNIQGAEESFSNLTHDGGIGTRKGGHLRRMKCVVEGLSIGEE